MFFGVNGASGLIQSALIAMANPGENILMPRNVHISVIKPVRCRTYSQYSLTSSFHQKPVITNQ